MSLIASISFSIHTVKKQMYDIVIVKNETYTNLDEQINKIKEDIKSLEDTKANELSLVNNELDGLTLDNIPRRNELDNKKTEKISFYDSKISDKTKELDQKQKEAETIENKETEKKTLKNNAIAGFFETLSNVFGADVDNIIVVFAVLLGVLLDTGSIVLIYDSAFSFESKRAAKKDNKDNIDNRMLNEEIQETFNNTEKVKIIDFETFKKVTIDKNLDELKYNDFIKKYDINSNSFYTFKDKLKRERQKEEKQKNNLEDLKDLESV